MGNYTTNPLRTGHETEKSNGLDTLGGEFGLCWNDTVPLTTGAHNAFLSAFFEAGGVFDRLVDTCPLRLTSNNAPTNRFKVKRTKNIREIFRLHLANGTDWEDAASAFAEIAGFLHKVTAASQLRVEQRWQLIIYWAFRKYRLISFSRVCFLKASPSWRPRMRLTFGIRPECVVRAQGREMQMQSMYKPDRGGRRPSSRRSSRRSPTS